MSKTPTYRLGAARSVLLDGQRWLSLEDAVTLLGASLTQEGVNLAAQLPGDCFRVHPLLGNGPRPKPEGVVTYAGLAKFLRISGYRALLDVADGLLAVSLAELAEVRSTRRSPAAGGVGTRWGVQPFRAMMRVKWPSLTVNDVVETMNLHVRTGEKRITKAAFDAIAVGRQLPSPTFLRCLMRTFQAVHEELLTPESLAAFYRKNPPVPDVPASSSSDDGYPPLAEFPPHIAALMQPKSHTLVSSLPSETGYDPSQLPDPEETDEDELVDMDAYWAKQDALMDAAAAEAIGMPGMSFEAGFAAVMGHAEPPVDPSDE